MYLRKYITILRNTGFFVMARQGISRDQVFTAAGALREEGIKPTVQAVRERLGSGSYSTINGFLAAWRSENAALAVADLPALPDKVQTAFTQIWAVAASQAREGVETQREALEAMQREIERERADMAAEIERLETVLDSANGQIDALRGQLSAANDNLAAKDAQMTELRIDNARLDERAKAAEQRGDELKSQLAGLQAEFAASVNGLKAEIARKLPAGTGPEPDASP